MIPLNQPWFEEDDEQAIVLAFRSGWVTGTGEYIDRLHEGFRALTGRAHAVACSSGTSALWLVLAALRLPAGAGVVVPTYTCDSLANVPLNLGLRPVPVDVEPETWGLSLAALTAVDEPTLAAVRAVVLVHTYGVPARDTEALLAYAAQRGWRVVEDASEAHGARLGDRPVGSFGTASVFSCRGEKTVSGGQLGIVVTDDARLARHMRQWAENGLPSRTVRFWSTVPALNMQPSHLNAALAVAQLARLDTHVARRATVHTGWRQRLAPIGFRFQSRHGEPAWWLTGALLPDRVGMLPQDLGAALAERGVPTRPGFYPLSLLPHVAPLGGPPYPMAETLLRRLIVLPSGAGVGPREQDEVTEAIVEILGL